MPTSPLVALIAKPIFDRMLAYFDPQLWPATRAAIYSAYGFSGAVDEYLAGLERGLDEDTVRVIVVRRGDNVFLPKDAVFQDTALYRTAEGPRKTTVKNAGGVTRERVELEGENYKRGPYLHSGPLTDGAMVYLHRLYAREGTTSYRNKNFDEIQSAWSKVRHLKKTIAGLTSATLTWAETTSKRRSIWSARYSAGHFRVIETREAWVLYYEWDDGSFVDFDVGNVDHLKWLAEHWVDNAMHGYDSFDAFLSAAKTADGALRSPAPKDANDLEWAPTRFGETMIHRAGLPRRGKYEIRRAKKDTPYTLTFKPIIGKHVRIGGEFKTAPSAKKAANKHAQRLVYGPRKVTRTKHVGDATLTWAESEEGGPERRVCIATDADGGAFQLVQIKGTNSFALFYSHDGKTGWQDLGCGAEGDLKRTAAAKETAKAKNRAAKKKKPKAKASQDAATPTPAAASDADKAATMKNDLKSMIGDFIEEQVEG